MKRKTGFRRRQRANHDLDDAWVSFERSGAGVLPVVDFIPIQQISCAAMKTDFPPKGNPSPARSQGRAGRERSLQPRDLRPAMIRCVQYAMIAALTIVPAI